MGVAGDNVYGVLVTRFDATTSPKRIGYHYGDAGTPQWSVEEESTTGVIMVMREKSADPATPAANTIALYCKDSGGVSRLFYKDDGGTVRGPL